MAGSSSEGRTSRTRSVGTKISDEEYARLGAGQKLETYTYSWGSGGFASGLAGINIYFGGKLLQSKDVRLGSVRANFNGESMSYWPYGEERTNTANDREKFGTYMRDGIGQDYAEQRYYNSNVGAFWTPDPGGIKTANPRNLLSWNRYAYVSGDPANHSDSAGMEQDTQCGPGWQTDPSLEGPCCNPGQGLLGAAPDPACYAGGGDEDEDDDDEATPNCVSGFASFMVSFVSTNYAASVTLGTEAGIPQHWILAWSADESSFGTSAIAKKSGNYFGWHGPGNIKCPGGTNKITGCFSSFLASGTTALFSERTWLNYNGNPRSSAGQILLNQYQNNASAATAFQALSNAGYNSNPNYGAQVAGSYFLGNVDGIENCLRSLGQLH